jgi:hypothetical protein
MRFLRQIPYRNLLGNQHEIYVQNAMFLNVTNGGSARRFTPVIAVLTTALLHDSQINPSQLCKLRSPAAVYDVITSRLAVFATATCPT